VKYNKLSFCVFSSCGTALILNIVFSIRNNLNDKRTTLHLAGTLPFRVAPLTSTAENSCQCNVMVMYLLIFDLSVVTDSINGNSIQFNTTTSKVKTVRCKR